LYPDEEKNVTDGKWWREPGMDGKTVIMTVEEFTAINQTHGHPDYEQAYRLVYGVAKAVGASQAARRVSRSSVECLT
jgi:hypothetical protein